MSSHSDILHMQLKRTMSSRLAHYFIPVPGLYFLVPQWVLRPANAKVSLKLVVMSTQSTYGQWSWSLASLAGDPI